MVLNLSTQRTINDNTQTIVSVLSLIVRCVKRLRTLPNMYCLGVVVDCPLCGKIENPT
jgi:hypothetical protein